MNKKLLRTSVIASVMAMAFTANAWAAYDTAEHGNSYEAKVVLSATNSDDDTGTGLGIVLYRGDKKSDSGSHLDKNATYMSDEAAQKALGDLWNSKYSYTLIESKATAEFNQVLSQTVIHDVVAMVENGENVYITGDGASEPYVINAVDSTIKSFEQSVKPDANGNITSTIIELIPKKDGNGSFVHNEDGTIQYEDKEYTQTVNISEYVSTKVNNEAGDAIINVGGNNTTIENAINQNTNTINQHTTTINEHATQIKQHTTAIENNTTQINNIKNNNVTNITKQETTDGSDIWNVTQTVNGDSSTIQITDEHINSYTMEIKGDNLESKITTNFGTTYEQSVRVGDATINYAGDIIVQHQDGNTTQLTETIENAINNNYTKIVNVENNNVSHISVRTPGTEEIGGKTYNVEYYEVTQKVDGQDVPVKIKDTTLVEKRLFTEHNPGWIDGYSDNNAIAYKFDEQTGIPQLFVEFEDTSGNVVQGAVDFGTLFQNSLNTEGDENIIVTPQGGGLGNYAIALANNITVDSVTIGDKVVVNNQGANMGDTKITNLTDGEVSKDSKEAINGSQLYAEQQARIEGDSMISNRIDKLGNRVDKVGAGAAALAALHPLDFDPDDKLQFSAGVGNYGGETATALGAFYRPTEKVMFSAAGTMGNGENMVNMGVTFALDRKNNVSNSRVAMAREIQDLRDQVAKLTALVTQLAGRNNPMLQDTVMFPDVPENHWAYDYVEGLQKRGIIEGYPDGNYGGDRSCTRYEYAAMLYRALEKGFPVDSRLLDEFDAELGRIRVDRIKGVDADANKIERVRVNDYADRDDYGSKLAAVVANAAPVVQ